MNSILMRAVLLPLATGVAILTANTLLSVPQNVMSALDSTVVIEKAMPAESKTDSAMAASPARDGEQPPESEQKEPAHREGKDAEAETMAAPITREAEAGQRVSADPVSGRQDPIVAPSLSPQAAEEKRPAVVEGEVARESSAHAESQGQEYQLAGGASNGFSDVTDGSSQAGGEFQLATGSAANFEWRLEFPVGAMRHLLKIRECRLVLVQAGNPPRIVELTQAGLGSVQASSDYFAVHPQFAARLAVRLPHAWLLECRDRLLSLGSEDWRLYALFDRSTIEAWERATQAELATSQIAPEHLERVTTRLALDATSISPRLKWESIRIERKVAADKHTTSSP